MFEIVEVTGKIRNYRDYGAINLDNKSLIFFGLAVLGIILLLRR